MPDYHAASLDHLNNASMYDPGTPEQAYHLHAASTLATLANADAAHRHAAAVERLGQINAQMVQQMIPPNTDGHDMHADDMAAERDHDDPGDDDRDEG